MSGELPTSSVPSVPLGGAVRGRWSVAAAFAFVLIVMGAAVLSGFVVQNAYLVWRDGIDAAFERGAAERLSAAERRDLFLWIQLSAQLLEVVLIFWLARRWHGRAWLDALNLVPARHGLGGYVSALVLLFAVKMAVTLLASSVLPVNPREELAPFVELVRPPLAWWLFLATVVIAGVTEELLFRGVLSRTLEATRLGFWPGAALVSAGFAILHMQYGVGGQVVIFAISMTLAWIRRRGGSLWPAIVCHAANNALALFAMRALG